MPHQSGARGRCSSVRLLGRWQLVVDGADVELGHREERLTALLGLAGRSSRPHIAGILWPESTDARALASLRSAILQTQKRCPTLLRADRLSIGLDAAVEVDVDRVRRAAAEDDAEALLGELAGEELLPGWYDDWVLPERERLEQVRVKAFERIARHALEAGDLTLTVDAARAASDLDPLLEWAGELAVRAHLGRGDRGSAVREFERYRDALSVELGAPPSRAVLELIEPVLAAPGEPRAAVASETPVVPAAAPEVPIPEPPLVPLAPLTPPVPPGTRGAGVRLLGLAVLVLATALALAGVGTGRHGGDGGGPGSGVRSPMQVLPADGAVRAGQLVVRLVGATAGRAAFMVRTTLQPAVVRLQVRGGAGRDVVRSLLVRSPQGRRLELSGLTPGIHRWLATTPVAAAVSGRLRMPDQPLAVDADATLAGGAPASSSPSPQPDSTVSASDAPAPSPPPSDHSSTPQSSTPEPDTPPPDPAPTGQPHDPGTLPPMPVG